MEQQLNTKLEKTKVKLTQVYRYLEALNQLRNPVQRQVNNQPWTLWLHDLPDHPSISRGIIKSTPTNPTDINDINEHIQSDDFILKVRRPELTRAPDPPEGITAWLQSGWQNVDGKVVTYSTKKQPSETGEPEIIRFEDDPQRVQKLKEWLVVRDQWVEAERPARQAMNIFDKLYALQAQLERESERLEIVLGDGILDWPRNGFDDIHHPILLQRLTLQFDPLLPEFTLAETDQSPELYTALFRSLPDVNVTSIGRCRADLELNAWHPIGGEETSGFLKRLVTQLSSRGEFINEFLLKGEKEVPRIGRDPVLFLRTRTLGFTTSLESILGDLTNCENAPSWMANIVGVEAQVKDISIKETGPNATGPFTEDEDILLAKEANPEQLQIARRLEKYGAVLVQGPPGTGKTHSIANLIGHLLAQGKTILVTSYAEKALKVLRSQVVEPLQPLCVSVLSDN